MFVTKITVKYASTKRFVHFKDGYLVTRIAVGYKYVDLVAN